MFAILPLYIGYTMEQVLFTIDLIPEEYREDLNLCYKIGCTLISGHNEDVQIGDRVCILSFCGIRDQRYFSFEVDVLAKTAGVNVYNRKFSGKFGDLLYTVFSREEYVTHFRNKYSLLNDPFTGEKSLHWDSINHLEGSPNSLFWLSGSAFKLRFEEGEPFLSIVYRKSVLKPKVKDQVTLHFNDDQFLTFSISKPPHSPREFYDASTYKEFDIPLTSSDIDLMLTYNLLGFKLSFKNGEPPHKEVNKYKNGSKELSQLLFKQYVIDFYKALTECGYHFNKEIPDNPSSPEPCYVYLMVDTSNGYHKIGISNHPEYREGTLQSEKPTIELLCAKKFPSRTIARAIESALHSTYESKHLRGEWFQLDAKDIIELTETLK